MWVARLAYCKLHAQVAQQGRTLYRTTQTNMLRGMRKKLMMVARISSGTCWERCFIMLGQKMPTANSKPQKAASWILPAVEMPVLQRLLQALT